MGMRQATWRVRLRTSSTTGLSRQRPQLHPQFNQLRAFRPSCLHQVVKPYLLADIGEGIREVQIIQWFVKPGARVEQFQKLCEVSSDKATVDITSRFDGIIKKLHYDADDMAQVGQPLVDIDIQSELSPEDEALTTSPEEAKGAEPPPAQDGPTQDSVAGEQPTALEYRDAKIVESKLDAIHSRRTESDPARHRTLATPAVRHLTKEHGINIADVRGTGKDGRVLKEDILNHKSNKSSTSALSPVPAPQSAEDKTVPLSSVQSQMFKAMTKALQIPHFLYSDAIDFTNLNALRRSINERKESQRLSALAFVVKATSLALLQYPVLNARLELAYGDKPHLYYRGNHNIGIAVDTPSGLLVPVVKGVQFLSISEIAAEISRLGTAGREGKLTSGDFSGGTFTVSNVGSIGGGVVSPVIVECQSAIIGVGKAKTVPAFDQGGGLTKCEECVLSWSADHRFVDGATVARAAETVKRFLEQPAEMAVTLR